MARCKSQLRSDASGQVVWITGAAGGLGRALCREFLRQGWRVAAGCHVTPLTEAHPRLLGVEADVTAGPAVRHAASQVLARWGRLDVLINNAGRIQDHACWQMSEPEWERVLAVNLKGAFLCSQAALAPMLAQGHGHIINLSSTAGRQGSRGQGNYAAAKAGLLGFTQALAREMGPRNIQVNAVLPGVLATPMTARASESQKQTWQAANVLGRLGEPEEVARFLVFLALMRHVSGQVFQLDSRIAAWT